MSDDDRVVKHGGKLYRWFDSNGYHGLHPIIDGRTDYTTTIMEHRLVYELAYDVNLPKNVVIHHLNADRADNRLSNLVAMSREDHAKLHRYEDLSSGNDHTQKRNKAGKSRRNDCVKSKVRDRLSNLVAYGDKIYYRRKHMGYYALHPVVDGVIDYGKQILEHRLVYELGHGVKLDSHTDIHHINHDKTDNNLQNLVAMSRSEHTTRHAIDNGMTVGQRYCADCGKPISAKAKRCRDCQNKLVALRYHRKQATKEQLEVLIKTMSNTQIGKMYGVSDKAVGKWRKKFGLPSAREQRRMSKYSNVE